MTRATGLPGSSAAQPSPLSMSTVIEAPSFITFVPPPTPKPASESSSSDRPSLQEPRRILLIEDDFMLRGSLSEFLQGEGYRVESAANGVDALRRLERPPRPALILLDIMLPYMDGLEFRAVQRATPDIADIPVIVITAVGVQPEVAKELDLRRRFFKPLDLPQLLAAIDQACPPLLS